MPSHGQSEFGMDSGSHRSRYGQSGRMISASAVSSPMNGLMDTRKGISFSSRIQLAPHRIRTRIGVDRVVLIGEVDVDLLLALGDPERHQVAHLVRGQRIFVRMRKIGAFAGFAGAGCGCGHPMPRGRQ